MAIGAEAAGANIVGGLLVKIKRRWDELLLKYFIALGVGFMLGAAFLGMIPKRVCLTHLSRRPWRCPLRWAS